MRLCISARPSSHTSLDRFLRLPPSSWLSVSFPSSPMSLAVQCRFPHAPKLATRAVSSTRRVSMNPGRQSIKSLTRVFSLHSVPDHLSATGPPSSRYLSWTPGLDPPNFPCPRQKSNKVSTASTIVGKGGAEEDASFHNAQEDTCRLSQIIELETNRT